MLQKSQHIEKLMQRIICNHLGATGPLAKKIYLPVSVLISDVNGITTVAIGLTYALYIVHSLLNLMLIYFWFELETNFFFIYLECHSKNATINFTTLLV